MTDSIKIIKLDTHPTLRVVRAATIFVHFEDGKANHIAPDCRVAAHSARKPRETATVGECVEYITDNGIIDAKSVKRSWLGRVGRDC
jgi:hypothetical protein